MSPIQAGQNPDYERMTGYQADSYWPSAVQIVVRHKATNTFWSAVYAIREDDSDAEYSASWRQVVPETVTITKYKNI